MKLAFQQSHSESGSVSGKGIDWYWSGRDASGDMEAVEEIAIAIEATIREELGDHLDEDEICELPIEAEVDWDGESVENVTDFCLDFGVDEDLEEVQRFFTTPLEFQGELKKGKNTVMVGDKTVVIQLS